MPWMAPVNSLCYALFGLILLLLAGESRAALPGDPWWPPAP